MERLSGATVRELCARGPLPAGDAVAIVTQVLAGLAALHEAGVSHEGVSLGSVQFA